MSRLARDGTVEPVSRDQILRRERGQGRSVIFPCSADQSSIGNLTRLICTLDTCDGHGYIYTVDSWYSSVIAQYFQLTHFIPIVALGKRGAY